MAMSMRTLGPLLVALTLAACGGSTVSPIDGGNGNDGGSGNDASSDAGGGSPCPPSPPTAGTKCGGGNGIAPQYECEYGSSSNRACNIVATCDDTGQWTLSSPAPGCGGKNPPTCPSTYASVPQGKSCSESYPLDCLYPEGICSCTPGAGGPVPLDAAAAATWHCDVPSDSKCPKPRPKLGSACSTPNLLCDYGACIFPSGTAMRCTNGYWQLSDVPCPL